MNKEDALSKFITDKISYYRPHIMINSVADIQQFFDFNPDIQDVDSLGTEHAVKWMIHLNSLSSKSIDDKYFAVRDLYEFLNERRAASVRQTLMLDPLIRQTGARVLYKSDFHFGKCRILE
jgi:site-specific recombinase XerD